MLQLIASRIEHGIECGDLFVIDHVFSFAGEALKAIALRMRVKRSGGTRYQHRDQQG